MKTIIEWLHENPNRMIVIRPSGHFEAGGSWVANEGKATFTLTTKLPDGRGVQSNVDVVDEMMQEPSAGDMIVQQAELAIAALLSREPQ